MHFECSACLKTYNYGELIWRCRCGSYINLKYDVRFNKNNIKTNRFNMWRYDSALPMKFEQVTASFDEGMTPLVSAVFNGRAVKVKLEYLMPTGSFKDRGTVMSINYLKNHGAKLITSDSSGNAAASVAAYCAISGLKGRVFVPAGNSPGKLAQITAYGAEVTLVEGPRENAAKAAQAYEDSYAGHNWHPMYWQGTKTIAYEIWEQQGFKPPDCVITTCGSGSSALGILSGFTELFNNGEITKIPKVYAVQPENCNPIARAFAKDTSKFKPKPTIAEGTSVLYPVKIKEVVEKLCSSGGAVISVTEDEIKNALKAACSCGFYIEPTSALAFAGFEQLISQCRINETDNTVIIASGSGLKAGDTISKLL